MAVPYVDARVVMDRLDDILGVGGWQDSYDFIPGTTSVICRLRVKIGGEWITKEDVGGMSEQPDEGDRTKAALSDALKRAAVKLGVGRYLYRAEPQWVPHDGRRFTVTPTLKMAKGYALASADLHRAAESDAAPAVPAAPNPPPQQKPPLSGEEWVKTIRDYDAAQAKKGVWAEGALVRHLAAEAKGLGWSADMTTWDAQQRKLASEEADRFRKEQLAQLAF
jgi:hypothetical protein